MIRLRRGLVFDGELLRTRGGARRRTSRHYAISWLIGVNPSRLAGRNYLDHQVYRTNRPFVTHQVYVPATYVGEAVACVVNRRRAGGIVSLVDGELAR